MKINVPQGKYVVAVSGGVDSVVLLDLLSNLKGVELVVAHFNHGIRKSAEHDEMFVKELANKYGLAVETGHGMLAVGASEQTARQARYAFLDEVKQKHEARAIITAHHQDDVIETAFINILRGTGPKGLISLDSTPDIVRPLLDQPKAKLIEYANQHNLQWVEDETNNDVIYLRNRLRKLIQQNLTPADRAKLIQENKRAATNS